MADGRLENDHDVEEVLKLAVRSAGFSDEHALRQRLHAAAGELGLSDAQLAAAEEQYFKNKTQSEERAEFEKGRRKDFYEHLCSYLIVNTGLMAFDFFGDGRISWALWPLIGWGIGIAFHTLSTYLTGTSDHEAEFKAWQRRRARRKRLHDRQERRAEEPQES